MKIYIVPEINVVELDVEALMALPGSTESANKTLTFGLPGDDATTPDACAASSYRSNLWGED